MCQHNGPFNGYIWSDVAPGCMDQWWDYHRKECGGLFLRIAPNTAPPKRKSVTFKDANGILNIFLIL